MFDFSNAYSTSHQTLLFQQLAEAPNRTVIGHTIGEVQAHKTAE
tara:strand:- start:247 stop:378 length:132 start_codon:yes stop_codon:yes gene_type:complete